MSTPAWIILLAITAFASFAAGGWAVIWLQAAEARDEMEDEDDDDAR